MQRRSGDWLRAETKERIKTMARPKGSQGAPAAPARTITRGRAIERTADVEPTEAMVQLATRIPAGLHREVKLHCVGGGISVMDFCVEALTEKLEAEQG